MQLVPILPVVTKSDTMTTSETVKYRTELHRRLQFPCLPSRKGSIQMFEFSEESMAACMPTSAIATAAAMRPPFLVVCSNYYNKACSLASWRAMSACFGTQLFVLFTAV